MGAGVGGVIGAGKAPLLRALGIGAGYALISYLSLHFTRFGESVESIWLSNALLTWALVTAPRGQWPLFILCAAAGHVAAHLSVGDKLDFTLAFLVGDMAEAALCAFLLGLRPRTLALENRAGVFYFLLICVLTPLASALIAAGADALIGRVLSARDFYIWFAADALGLIVFLPIFYGIGEGRWGALKNKPLRLVAALVAIVGLSAFAAWRVDIPTLRLLLLPVFVIIAFELGVAGVEISLAALLFTWAATTVSGRPPTPWYEVSERDYMVVLQIFMAIFAATLLPLAVILEEKNRLNATLKDCLDETREAWGAIIGAEARYRLVVDNVSETVMRVAPDGTILFASPACTALLHGDHGIEGRNLFALMHPEDEGAARERFEQSLAQGLLNLAHRWRWRSHGDDGVWALIDARVTLVAPGGAGHEEFVVVLRPEG